MLIIACRTRTDRLGTQVRIEQVALLFGQFVQDRAWLGAGGEDALHGRKREGAEADGVLQGGQRIGTLVLRQQGQELLRLLFAVRLLGAKAVEEMQGDRPEFVEAALQQGELLPGIATGLMAWAHLS